VGTVPLLPDGSVVLTVDVVQRTWSGHGQPTHAPAAVEVRREPSCEMGDPGGMSAAAADALARLLTKAARRARDIGAAPAEPGAARAGSRS
jgi:hypothetical protein